MIENVPLFDLATRDTLTAKQIIDAVDHGINPFNGEHDPSLADGLYDAVYNCWRSSDTPIGTFESVTNWNGGDGHEMGLVVQHKETGLFFMATGTYSSWDASEWHDGLVEAEPYTFTETRYKAV